MGIFGLKHREFHRLRFQTIDLSIENKFTVRKFSYSTNAANSQQFVQNPNPLCRSPFS